MTRRIKQRMENKNWLKELKVGDDVLVREYSWTGSSWSKAKVEKITPTGFIKVKDILYKPQDGYSRSGNSCLYDPNDGENLRLLRLFDEKRFISAIIDKIRKMDSRNMTYEQAVEISKIMGFKMPE